MQYRREHDSQRVAWAALTGAMVGAGVALLFAPKPGAQVRDGIRGSVGSLHDAVRQRYRRLGERATAAIEQVHGTAGHALAAVEHGVRHYKAAVMPRPGPPIAAPK